MITNQLLTQCCNVTDFEAFVFNSSNCLNSRRRSAGLDAVITSPDIATPFSNARRGGPSCSA